MKNEPINKDAFGYIRLHVYMYISKEEFVAIEKYVAEMHDSLYPNGIYGDGDLKKYVIDKLKISNIYISKEKVDSVVSALYDFMYENKNLLSISLHSKFEKWYDWDETIQKSIHEFYTMYNIVPNFAKLSEYTKSQIEYVTSISPKIQQYGEKFSTLHFVNIEGNKTNLCSLKLQIDNSISDRYFMLLYLPNGGDDNLDDPIKIIPTDTYHLIGIGT